MTSGAPAAAPPGDGVPPSIAALPDAVRVRQVPRGPGGDTRVQVAGDGAWLVSRPEGAPAGYGELLHLDAGGRILRAYPFPGVGPQWVMVTSRAVYCGRHGEAGSPDAMVCRVDRATGELRVRVVADLAADAVTTPEEVAGRPGSWVVDDRNFVVDLGVAPEPGSELTFRSRGGVLRLSPDTLGVLGS